VSNVRDSCTGPETLIPGALRGYRTWRIDGPKLLTSSIIPSVWLPGEKQAECLRHDSLPRCPESTVPNAGCRCGIYGWYRPDSRSVYGLMPVFGVIEAYGRVLLGSHGFRAERARVVAICPGGRIERSRRLLEMFDYQRSIGVDVYDTVESMLEAYPPDDLSALGIDPDAAVPVAPMSMAAAAAMLSPLARSLAHSIGQVGRALSPLADALTELQRRAGVLPVDQAARVRALQLELKRNRNTGPKSVDRPPKRIDPTV
jgi:hypothetical protein